jgi:SynChlorMet cassette radical SAM/SPASM protein ScmE
MTALADLPTAVWLSFFEELGRLGMMRVCVAGGEPFVRPDLFELIDGLIANRMRYSVLSNGTLIDENMLAKFEVGKRRLRLDYIQISIDGSCAEIHDKSRPGSFEKAIRGLRLLMEHRFPMAVRITINRHNLHDLENTAKLLLEDIGVPSVGTNDAMPIGSGCPNEPEVALTPREYLVAMKTMERLRTRYPGRLTATAGPQARLKMQAEMEEAKRTGVKTTRWGMGYLTACGCIFNKLDFLHDGTIVPCNMLPDLKLGNITTDSLEEIWRDHPTLRALRERRFIAMRDVPGCGDCEWNEYCNGSCPGLAHQMLGDFNLPNPRDCYRRFLEDTKETECPA